MGEPDALRTAPGRARSGAALAAGLLACCALAGLAACGSVVPRLQPPQLQVAGVDLLGSDFSRQQLRVRMKVHNPNDRALVVRGITYKLEVEGEELAHGESERNFTIPALGDGEFDLDVTANAAGALLRFGLQRGGPDGKLDYRLSGRIRLDMGLLRWLDFDERGAIPLR